MRPIRTGRQGPSHAPPPSPAPSALPLHDAAQCQPGKNCQCGYKKLNCHHAINTASTRQKLTMTRPGRIAASAARKIQREKERGQYTSASAAAVPPSPLPRRPPQRLWPRLGTFAASRSVASKPAMPFPSWMSHACFCPLLLEYHPNAETPHAASTDSSCVPLA